MPPVELTVREASFVLKLSSGCGGSLIISRRAPFRCEVRDGDWKPSTEEFIVDSVEVAAVFGALEIENEMYLVVSREADLAAELEGERFWNLKRAELIAFGDGSLMSSFAVGNVRSFLCSALFYFSDSARLLNEDEAFDWGAGLRSFSDLPDARAFFFAPLLHGYVGQRRRFVPASEPLLLTVVARRSARRAGTRFSARGIDEAGDVGSFVETEILVSDEVSDQVVFRHVQVRGSVPLFWQQQASSRVPELTRRPLFMRRAFAKHMQRLRRKYGELTVVDLLSRAKEGERVLSEEYGRQTRLCGGGGGGGGGGVEFVQFDFNANTVDSSRGLLENLQSLRVALRDSVRRFGHGASNSGRSEPQHQHQHQRQRGVIRTSCLDCLDRTNAVQLVVALEALQEWGAFGTSDEELQEGGSSIIPEELLELFVELGDAVSLASAGAGSVFARYLRSAGTDRLGSFFQQTWRGAERLYAHHFESEDRDAAITALLQQQQRQRQRQRPASEAAAVAAEGPGTGTVSVGVVTFNMNGRKFWEEAGEAERVLRPVRGSDVVVVGVQELVKLDISGFLSSTFQRAEESRAEQWERACRTTLQETHVVLEHVTLVGLDLTVLVRKSLAGEVTSIEKLEVKTGAGGTAGNKGGVGVIFEIFPNNKFCFINVHLDSGELKHHERALALHAVLDAAGAESGAESGASSGASGNVVVLGDFNFRLQQQVQLQLQSGAGEAGSAAAAVTGVLQALRSEDSTKELLLSFDEGLNSYALHKFRKTLGFKEGEIHFPPTYKFVNGSGNYSLERVPAWCDRVFFKAQEHITCNLYEALLEAGKSSDHRPVVALLEVQVRGRQKTAPATATATATERPEPVGSAVEREWVVIRHNYLD